MARRGEGGSLGFEPLEGRVAMRAGVGFGAVGDSLTDEYRFYPPDRSRASNWVEILARTRGLDFGDFSGRGRGLPRDRGFANNWALSGATSQDVVADQLPGLARQVRSGRVRYASVNMGTDDFLFFLAGEAASLPPAGVLEGFPARLAAVGAAARANFDTAVGTLLAANPRAGVVVATVADLHQVPIVARFLGNPAVKLAVDAAQAAVGAFNAHVREVAAAEPRVALADLAARSAPLAGLSSVRFGGVRIRLDATGDGFRNLVLADGIHPGTVGQGLIADAFIEAVATLGVRVKRLRPGEIVRFARDRAR